MATATAAATLTNTNFERPLPRTFAIYFKEAKYEFLKQFKLRGFSAWVLGAEDPSMWNVLPTVAR